MKVKQLTGTMTPNKARAVKPTHSESPKTKDTTANEPLVEKGNAGSGAPLSKFDTDAASATLGKNSGLKGRLSNNISVSIDLRHLSESARRLAPEHIGNTADQPNAQPPAARLHGLSSEVAVDMNVTGDFAGDQTQCGTSFFAAGRAALEFARAELARVGIERADLDKLTTEHVTIRNAFATFLVRFDDHAEVAPFSKAMNQRALSLGMNVRHDPIAQTFECRGFCTDPQSASTSSGQSPTEVVLFSASRPNLKLVRLDLKLCSDYLIGRGWAALDSWRDAYDERRYLAIFNENVRRLFRLAPSDHLQVPSGEMIERLSSTAQVMLRNYMAGKNPKTCGRFPAGYKKGRANSSELKDIREEILNQLGINIMIPWAQFRDQIPPLLVTKLGYPGDFQPLPEKAQSFFCKASWPKFLAALREAYETAMAIAAQQQQANTGGGNRG